MWIEAERRRSGGAATCGTQVAGEREVVRVSSGTLKELDLSFEIVRVRASWLWVLVLP